MADVKVCGITRAEDARLAVALGARALGFVLWPKSPRAVAPRRVREITRGLPAFVATVGVFVNQAQDDVEREADDAGLTAVQLHGDEDASRFSGSRLKIIKAVGVGERFSVESVDEVPPEVTVLLDTHDPVRRGGTGRTIDWSLAAAAARRRPIVLSGGLTPDNVRSALEQVRPYAVDVSSGVEAAPGVKDETRMRAFFAAVRSGRLV